MSVSLYSCSIPFRGVCTVGAEQLQSDCHCLRRIGQYGVEGTYCPLRSACVGILVVRLCQVPALSYFLSDSVVMLRSLVLCCRCVAFGCVSLCCLAVMSVLRCRCVAFEFVGLYCHAVMSVLRCRCVAFGCVSLCCLAVMSVLRCRCVILCCLT